MAISDTINRCKLKGCIHRMQPLLLLVRLVVKLLIIAIIYMLPYSFLFNCSASLSDQITLFFGILLFLLNVGQGLTSCNVRM